MDTQASGPDYLQPAERAKLDALRAEDPSAASTLAQVDRILASETFRAVRWHARAFLQFVVAWKLLGLGHRITEKMIAIRVFGEPPDYNPAEGTGKVKVAAAGLRQRLAGYYENEGRKDQIEICIPNGRYVPQIVDRCISIGIGRFVTCGLEPTDRLRLDVICDDLVDALVKAGIIRVHTFRRGETAPPSVRHVLQGSLATLKDRGIVRLDIYVLDLHTKQVIDARTFEQPIDKSSKLPRDIAAYAASLLLPKPAPVKSSRRHEPAPRKQHASSQRRPCRRPC